MNEKRDWTEWEREILRLSERMRHMEESKVPPIEKRSIDNSIKIGENKTKIEVMKETDNIGSIGKAWATVARAAKDNPVATVFIGLVLFLLLFLIFPQGVIELAKVLTGGE